MEAAVELLTLSIALLEIVTFDDIMKSKSVQKVRYMVSNKSINSAIIDFDVIMAAPWNTTRESF